MKILRSIFGVVVGVLVGGALVAAIEASGQSVFPPPPGLDPTDPESFRALMDEIPAGAFLLLLVAHFFGSLIGAWLAARVGAYRHTLHAAITAGVFLAFGVANLVRLPHPWWFAVADVAAYVAAGWLAGRLAAPAPRMAAG